MTSRSRGQNYAQAYEHHSKQGSLNFRILPPWTSSTTDETTELFKQATAVLNAQFPGAADVWKQTLEAKAFDMKYKICRGAVLFYYKPDGSPVVVSAATIAVLKQSLGVQASTEAIMVLYIGTHPDYVRQHHGQSLVLSLMQTAIEKSNTCMYTDVVQNRVAKGFWKSCCFELAKGDPMGGLCGQYAQKDTELWSCADLHSAIDKIQDQLNAKASADPKRSGSPLPIKPTAARTARSPTASQQPKEHKPGVAAAKTKGSRAFGRGLGAAAGAKAAPGAVREAAVPDKRAGDGLTPLQVSKKPKPENGSVWASTLNAMSPDDVKEPAKKPVTAAQERTATATAAALRGQDTGGTQQGSKPMVVQVNGHQAAPSRTAPGLLTSLGLASASSTGPAQAAGAAQGVTPAHPPMLALTPAAPAAAQQPARTQVAEPPVPAAARAQQELHEWQKHSLVAINDICDLIKKASCAEVEACTDQGAGWQTMRDLIRLQNKAPTLSQIIKALADAEAHARKPALPPTQPSSAPPATTTQPAAATQPAPSAHNTLAVAPTGGQQQQQQAGAGGSGRQVSMEEQCTQTVDLPGAGGDEHATPADRYWNIMNDITLQFNKAVQLVDPVAAFHELCGMNPREQQSGHGPLAPLTPDTDGQGQQGGQQGQQGMQAAAPAPQAHITGFESDDDMVEDDSWKDPTKYLRPAPISLPPGNSHDVQAVGGGGGWGQLLPPQVGPPGAGQDTQGNDGRQGPAGGSWPQPSGQPGLQQQMVQHMVPPQIQPQLQSVPHGNGGPSAGWIPPNPHQPQQMAPQQSSHQMQVPQQHMVPSMHMPQMPPLPQIGQPALNNGVHNQWLPQPSVTQGMPQLPSGASVFPFKPMGANGSSWPAANGQPTMPWAPPSSLGPQPQAHMLQQSLQPQQTHQHWSFIKSEPIQ